MVTTENAIDFWTTTMNLHCPTARVYWICFGLLIVSVWASPPTAGQETKTSTNTTDEARHVEALKSARASLARRGQLMRLYGNAEDAEIKELQQKFQTTLRQEAPIFSEFNPRERKGTNRFFTLELNKHGAGLDGFRFRNNSTEARNFAWIFAAENAESVGWFIVPMVEHPFQGFRGLFYDPTLFYTNAPWGRSGRDHKEVVQFINDKSFLPGREYIAWFTFSDARPHRLHVAFEFFPANKPMETRAAVEEFFGLKGPALNDPTNHTGVR